MCVCVCVCVWVGVCVSVCMSVYVYTLIDTFMYVLRPLSHERGARNVFHGLEGRGSFELQNTRTC